MMLAVPSVGARHSAAACGRSRRSRRNRLATVLTRLCRPPQRGRDLVDGELARHSAAASSTGSALRRSMNSQTVAASSASTRACVVARSTIRVDQLGVPRHPRHHVPTIRSTTDRTVCVTRTACDLPAARYYRPHKRLQPHAEGASC